MGGENIINENCDCGADFFMCHDGSIVCDESDCVDIPDNYPNWVDSPGQYEYTAYVNGVIFYEDEQMADEGDLFAAFDDDGNIRGLGTALFVPFGPYENSTLWEITLRSNEEIGDVLSFQYYDSSHDIILDILETYTFLADELSGSLVDPLEFTGIFSEEEEEIVGDLNGDGLINIVDIVSLVNIILYIGEYNSTGDVNEDGTLNVVDIVIMVNWILGSTSE